MSYADKRISKDDLTGQVFGYRTVVRYKGLREGKEYWECLCQCGKSKFVQANALKTGKAKSCGCFRATRVTEYNEGRRGSDPWVAEMNTHAYRMNWERVNKGRLHKTWELTLEEYRSLSTGTCFYCGREPSGTPLTKVMQNLGLKRSGIDRKDNTLGYTSSNCVSCCTACNRDKGSQSMCGFIEATIRRYEHLRNNNWLQDP